MQHARAVESSIGTVIDAVPLGAGGIADVFAGTHQPTGRPAVVKVVNVDTTAAMARFRREVESVRRLQWCAEVPGLLDLGEISDTERYLVLERVDGPSAQTVIDEGGPIPWDRACALLAQLALTVHHAHVVGVVHRDIKPANVIFNGATPHLVDFGSAQPSLDRTVDIDRNDLVLSPGYSAPEAYVSARTHRPADIFALGATLWALLSGRPPFSGGTDKGTPSLAEAARRTASDDRTPLGTPIPGELGELLDATLAFEPDARPQSAAELARRLRPFAG